MENISSINARPEQTEDESEVRRLETLVDSLGSEFMTLWPQADVTEINLNDDGKMWVKRHGHLPQHFGDMPPDEAMNVISLVADSVQEIVSFQHYKLECEFPLDGSRFSALVPPVVRAPSFSLRKHNPLVLPLADFVEKGVFPEQVRDIIRTAIAEKLNFLVVGGCGSGKTTLVNGIINEMATINPSDRVVIAEDTRELKSNFENTLSLRTTVAAPLEDIVSVILRHTPDRIFVGEVRDKAALNVLMLWNTGHPGGICTIHANSARETFERVEEMVRQACHEPLPKVVGQAVDIILFLEPTNQNSAGRKLTQVVRCHGYDSKEMTYILEDLYNARD